MPCPWQIAHVASRSALFMSLWIRACPLEISPPKGERRRHRGVDQRRSDAADQRGTGAGGAGKWLALDERRGLAAQELVHNPRRVDEIPKDVCIGVGRQRAAA